MTKNTPQAIQIYTRNGERYIIDKTGHQLIPLIKDVAIMIESHNMMSATEKHFTWMMLQHDME